MKKQSKRKRKLKNQKRITATPSPRNDQKERKAPCEESLNGKMVIKKKISYAPTPIDAEILTTACGNEAKKTTHQILFRPHAVKVLKKQIAWGEKTAFNQTEQQGILLGQVYQTPTGYTGVVEEVILSEAIGNQVFVESEHAQWFAMERKMDQLNVGRKRKLVRVGWWHTHPNMNVFMSGTDKHTQSLYFYKDWQYAVVLNPQDERIAAFIGENAEPCACYFVNTFLGKLK